MISKIGIEIDPIWKEMIALAITCYQLIASLYLIAKLDGLLFLKGTVNLTPATIYYIRNQPWVSQVTIRDICWYFSLFNVISVLPLTVSECKDVICVLSKAVIYTHIHIQTCIDIHICNMPLLNFLFFALCIYTEFLCGSWYHLFSIELHVIQVFAT